MSDHPFVGWLRTPGRPWKAVCGAETREGCWDLLLPLRVLGVNVGIEKAVLERGKVPKEKFGGRKEGQQG